jgi:Arc/MetJ-type ribon-helix-helix transcriptional regulator
MAERITGCDCSSERSPIEAQYDKNIILVHQIMKSKIAVTLDTDLIKFLDAQAGGNRSEFINKLLKERRQQILEEQTISALQADLADPSYREEIALWDSLAGDGIDA